MKKIHQSCRGRYAGCHVGFSVPTPKQAVTFDQEGICDSIRKTGILPAGPQAERTDIPRQIRLYRNLSIQTRQL